VIAPLLIGELSLISSSATLAGANAAVTFAREDKIK